MAPPAAGWRRQALALGPALLLLACREDPAARRLRAEERVLRRQVASLRELVAATHEGHLVEEGWLAVAVDESALRALLQASLPQEGPIADRLLVRIEKATVAFRSGGGFVTLAGRVTDLKSPDRFADVLFRGGIVDLEVDRAGVLGARVVLDDVEVAEAQAGGADPTLVASVVDRLAGRYLSVLQGLIPPVRLPVKLDQTLAIPGFGDGPVQVTPGELPIHVTVARVLPLSGRLFVLLDVSAGPWKRTPARPTSASTAGQRPGP